MTNAYEALVKAGGIGPIQGSQYGRQFQAMTGLVLVMRLCASDTIPQRQKSKRRSLRRRTRARVQFPTLNGKCMRCNFLN